MVKTAHEIEAEGIRWTDEPAVRTRLQSRRLIWRDEDEDDTLLEDVAADVSYRANIVSSFGRDGSNACCEMSGTMWRVEGGDIVG